MTPDVTVETIQYDFNNDGALDQLQLLVPEGWEGSGDFTKVALSLSGQDKPFMLEDPDGWTHFEEYYVGTPSAKTKQFLQTLSSTRAAVVSVPKDAAYLFLFGYPYVSSPGKLRILRITASGVESIFAKEFQVLEVADLNGDGKPELAGMPDFTDASEDAPGMQIEVYSFKKGKLELDTALSQSYKASLEP